MWCLFYFDLFKPPRRLLACVSGKQSEIRRRAPAVAVAHVLQENEVFSGYQRTVVDVMLKPCVHWREMDKLAPGGGGVVSGLRDVKVRRAFGTPAREHRTSNTAALLSCTTQRCTHVLQPSNRPRVQNNNNRRVTYDGEPNPPRNTHWASVERLYDASGCPQQGVGVIPTKVTRPPGLMVITIFPSSLFFTGPLHVPCAKRPRAKQRNPRGGRATLGLEGACASHSRDQKKAAGIEGRAS